MKSCFFIRFLVFIWLFWRGYQKDTEIKIAVKWLRNMIYNVVETWWINLLIKLNWSWNCWKNRQCLIRNISCYSTLLRDKKLVFFLHSENIFWNFISRILCKLQVFNKRPSSTNLTTQNLINQEMSRGIREARNQQQRSLTIQVSSDFHEILNNEEK